MCHEILRVTEILATHVTRTLEGVIETLVTQKFPDWETHTIW